MENLLSVCSPGTQNSSVFKVKGSSENEEDLRENYALELIAQGLLRWGEVKTSGTAFECDTNMGDNHVGHLSFGSEDHDVQDPVDGRLYS
jgi:hypothetical protein